MIKHIITLLVGALAATSLPAVQAPPDLVPIADASRNYVHGWYLDQTTQTGNVLLRLSTAMGNRGTGALELFGGVATTGGTQEVFQRVYDSNGTYSDRLAGYFVYHPSHGHLHFEGFAIYNLRTITTGGGVGPIIAAGGKTSFCLINVTQYWPSITSSALVPNGRGGSSCGQVQGISSGYADVYGASLTDQWINVTNVPSGNYWLEVIADPNNAVLESDETNNTVRIQISYTNPNGGTTNRAPTVTNPGTQSTVRGTAVNLAINASDPDGNPLTYTATGLPLGLGIDASTGRITGTVSTSAVASYTTTVVASDGQLQGSATFTWGTTAPLNGTGLRAQYFSGTSLGTLVFTRNDPLLDFTWGAGTPDARLAADDFSTRWSGKVIPAITGTTTFTTRSDDGARVWINGTLILDSWTGGGLRQASGTANLTAGQEADIRVEYFESTGSAEFHLLWSGTGLTQQVIPTNRLIPAIGNEPPLIFSPGPQTGVVGTVTSVPVNATDPNSDLLTFSATGLPNGLAINSGTGVISGTYTLAGTFNCVVTVRDASLSASTAFTWTVTQTEVGSGLHAEYFNDRSLSSEVVHRVDPVVDFNWGTAAPAAGMNADNFSIRWNGEMLPQYSQTYTFKIICDGGVKLWVNNMPMIFAWEPTGTLQTLTATWNLTAGQRTPIRLEYNDTTGAASVRLLWSSASQAEQVIPTARLFPTEYQPPADTSPPSVVLSTPATSVTTSFPVNVVFSEPVLDLTASDFVITNGTASLSSSTGQYALSVTPAAAGAVTISLPAGRAFDASGNGNTASNTLTVTYAPPSSGIFTGGDIGSPPIAGSTSFAGSLYTVRGSGADIYGTADSFHFARASLTGDGEIIARVTSMTNTNPWAKAGVMIRETLAAGSRNAIMYVPPYESGNISEMMWRQTTGGLTTYFDGPAQGVPPGNWLRLVRSGDVVTGFHSANGTSWTPVSSVTFASLPATVYFGLAVCGVSTTQIATATFDNVRVSTIAPTLPAPPTNLAAAGTSASSIRVTWTDAATNETGYRVERATGSGTATFSVIATLPAGATGYDDSSLAASTTYSYKVSAFNALGSAAAAPVSGTTLATGGSTLVGADVGGVAIAGSTVFSNNTYTLRGSGSDIYGTADSFQFASRAITGDAEIIARVTGMTNTASWAKAGIMIRETLATGSRHAIVYSTPYESGNGTEMMWRQTAGGGTAYFDGVGANPPPNNWLRLVRSGNSVSGYFSANGTSWSLLQTVNFNSLASSVSFGLCVCSANNAALATATFDNVTIAPLNSSGLTGRDIGAVGLVGSTSLSGGAYTVRGSGSDIYGTADSFHFASTTLSGDVDFRVRVTGMTNTASWAKAGIMIREFGTAGSRHAILYTTPYETGNGTEMMWRQTTDGGTEYFDGVAANPPPNNWLCLQRSGNTITSYVSADGSSWARLRSVTFTSLPATLAYGLCVCSANNAALATATFDNLQIIGPAGAPLAQSTQNTLSGSLPGITMPELQPATAADGGTSLSFVSAASSPASYQLQVLRDLSASPSGWRPCSVAPDITVNADGTATASFSRLPNEIAGLPCGFARLHAELDANGDGFADVQRDGPVVGFARQTFPVGTSSFSHPFAPVSMHTTSIVRTGASTLTLAAAVPALPRGEYYAEIIRGAHEGHRFELNESSATGATITVDVGHPRSTLASLPSSLVGDTLVIRRHSTIGEVLPSRAFTAGTSPATADRVMFFTGSAYETLWLWKRSNGAGQWTRQGDATLADASDRVLDVTEGVLVAVRSTPVTIHTSGFVRPTAIAMPVKAGARLAANPWPADMSPNALGMTAARGFIGASNPASADRLQLWKGDQSPGLSGYDTLFLLATPGYNQWTAQGDATLQNIGNTPLLPVMRAFFVRAVNDKPAFVIPRVWTP